MGYYDKEDAERLGIEKLPEGNFVLPIVNGPQAGKWLMRYEFMGGGGTSGGTVDTEQEGLDYIESRLQSDRRSWREKVLWRLAGDVADERRPSLSVAQEAVVYSGGRRPLTGREAIDEYLIHGGEKPDVPRSQKRRNVLRHGGGHYVVSTFGVNSRDRSCKGFGGRVFRWIFLDDPDKTVHESDNVFWQGEIPAEFRDDLPDNVEWVDNQYARPTRMF